MADELIEPGNIDLHNRPVHKNKDGSISTVRSMSINEDGQEILIPTVRQDGKLMGDDEAINVYHVSGQHLGKFKSAEAASKYAEQLHVEQEKEYVKPWTNTREDGPNDTAVSKTISYNSGPGTMTLNAEDQHWNGVPSRVVTNMAVNVDEDEALNVSAMTVKGLESELSDMTSSGRTQLVTPVADDAQSVEFKRLAGRNGATYGEVEQDGQRYGVMVPGTAPKTDSLADSFKTADAIKAGYKPEEVQSFLSKQGYDQAQIDTIIDQSNKVVQARDAGYNDEEIGSFLTSKEIQVSEVTKTSDESKKAEDPTGEWAASAMGKGLADAYASSQQTGKTMTESYLASYGIDYKDQLYKRLTSDTEMSAEDLLTSMKVLAPNMASMSTRTAAFFGNQEASAKAEAGLQASRAKIIKMAADRGLNIQWDDSVGAFLAETDNGPVPINESVWDDIWSSKGEITGGIAGAVLGGKGGAAVGAPFGPVGSGVGLVVGSLGGGAIGSALGSQFDYMYQAIKLQEDMEGTVMAHKALTAAEMSAVGDVLGLGVIKGGGATMKVIKRVKDFVLDGNTAGAYKALKDVEFMTDDQASQLVNQLERISKSSADTAGRSFEERAIAAATLTKPGSEGLVKAAAAVSPKVGRAVAQSIDDRAKDLLRVTGETSGENLSKLLREDLGNYVADVKNQFGEVKRIAAQSPRASNFRFNYDQLAVQPVLDKLQKNIMDPAVLERFSLQAQHIRDMSDSRTFADLLELRQLVNDFKFNKRITKTADFETLNGVLKGIDAEIYKGAQVAVDNPAQWLKDYSQARIDYAKMKQVEANVMYKALNKPGINEDEVTKSLARYIPALDGTFNDLMTKLPLAMRGRVENSVVDTLANKYTAGVGEGLRATNFPLLAKELNGVSLTTPAARQMKAAINELAEVFKNDVPLSQITGTIQIPKFQSYLTADPIVRAKYEVASRMFNYVKTLLPNKEQGTLALVRKTSALLENPLNAKTMRELMNETAGKVDVSPAILKLQQDAARATAQGKDLTMPRVKLYGNGSVLGFKGAGPEQTIPVHRIASVEDAARIAATEGVNPADTKLLDGILSSYGYRGVQQGTDRVRLLKAK